jgi:hypothetical protein
LFFLAELSDIELPVLPIIGLRILTKADSPTQSNSMNHFEGNPGPFNRDTDLPVYGELTLVERDAVLRSLTTSSMPRRLIRLRKSWP